ncbi:acyl-CoA dehydrogenase family protein [Rhodococcus globerulus]|uniref:acyl-CoA dehydrogenase family protein n=1 Tax=Rhodococcus globerulus TaxID=33008 RepID=UPI00301A5371
MDFTLDEVVVDVRDLARGLFERRLTDQRLCEVESSASRVDGSLWSDLADAGLLGIGLPEAYGGARQGLDVLCAVLQEQGRVVAPVPLWPAYVAGLALAEYGSEAQRDAILPGLADGSVRVTVAVEEFGRSEALLPSCTARRRGNSWVLNGEKALVPGVVGADWVVVAATTDTGSGLFLVPVAGSGITWERLETSAKDLAGNLILDEAPATALGSPGDGALDALVENARLGIAAMQLGVAESAVALAVTYLSTRHQFGRPLATFQAVQHQLADCYIHIDALRTCLWQAVELRQNGRPSAAAVDIAKWWADDAGLKIVFTVVHIHGGIGVDVSYPVHRHFNWGKQLSGTLGGRSGDLARLGARLAEGIAS